MRYPGAVKCEMHEIIKVIPTHFVYSARALPRPALISSNVRARVRFEKRLIELRELSLGDVRDVGAGYP